MIENRLYGEACRKILGDMLPAKEVDQISTLVILTIKEPELRNDICKAIGDKFLKVTDNSPAKVMCLAKAVNSDFSRARQSGLDMHTLDGIRLAVDSSYLVAAKEGVLVEFGEADNKVGRVIARGVVERVKTRQVAELMAQQG